MTASPDAAAMGVGRREFSKKVRLAAWLRSGGNCEWCRNKITLGNGPEYHHVLEATLGGEPTLENCLVVCIKPCHRALTSDRRPEIDRTRSQFEKRINARTKRQGFRGWRKFDGTLVRNPHV